MSRRVRVSLLTPALLGLGGLFAWAIAGLPAFGDYRGPYGYVLNRIVVPLRHATNVVMGTTFDVRGVDTMGEEFILYAAVLGVTLLLRDESGARRAERHTRRLRSDAVRLVGVVMVGVGLLVGLWLVAFGFVTPGGGFQGGVALAGGLLLVFLSASYRSWSGVATEHVLDPFEGIGAGGYVVVGLAALIGGMQFLTNLLGPGVSGTLWSGGSAPFVNWAAGMEVAAANLILFNEFLDEYVVPLATGSGRS